jgi:hypothetical protein
VVISPDTAPPSRLLLEQEASYDIVASVMLVSPCYCYVSLILLVWRIGFGVTGLELRSVDSDSSGLRPVDSRKAVVDIIPKSKDRFMERPPMKIVQP